MSTLQRDWERERKEKGNVVINLLRTWEKVHHQQTAAVPEMLPQKESRDSSPEPEPESEAEREPDPDQSDDDDVSDLEEESADSAESASDIGSCGEDIIEDFNLSSSEDGE